MRDNLHRYKGELISAIFNTYGALFSSSSSVMILPKMIRSRMNAACSTDHASDE